MEESLSKFMNESAKRHEENSNLIKEIQAFTDAAIRNQRASIKTLEIQIVQMSKVLQERGSRSLPSLTEANPRDHNSNLIFKPRQATIPFPSHLYDDCYEDENGSYRLNNLDAYSIGTTLRNDTLPRKKKDPRNRTVKHPKGIAKNVLVEIGKFFFPIDFIILDMPEDVNVPLILGRPCLSTTYAKVDVFKTNIALRVGDEKIIFKSVKPASSLIKRVYMLSLRERMEFDLEARLMGETLIMNRSFDPLYGYYIELNEPLELRRNQVDNLEPIIEEGEVDNKPMIDIVKTRLARIQILSTGFNMAYLGFWDKAYRLPDLAGKKSTTLVEYLSGI
ncbi:ribonuclease H-like domain, reverse transcriptase, RNA-dependent DNA polymerase [Tanacetum coccineum]